MIDMTITVSIHNTDSFNAAIELAMGGAGVSCWWVEDGTLFFGHEGTPLPCVAYWGLVASMAGSWLTEQDTPDGAPQNSDMGLIIAAGDFATPGTISFTPTVIAGGS